MCARDDVAEEAELFCAVGDGVVEEAAHVVAGVVLEAGRDEGVVGDAGGEAGGELGEDAAGVGEEDAEGGVAVEDACEDEARDGGGGLEGKAEGEGEDVSVVLRTERGCADAVVGVEEHDEAGVCERGPERLEPGVVETAADASGADDDALEVGEGCDVGDRLEQARGGDVVAEGQEAERVEALERGNLGCCAADGVEVCVEVVREGVRVCRREEVEPRVGWAVERSAIDRRVFSVTARSPEEGDVYAMAVHELEFLVHVPVLRAHRPPRERLVLEDDEALLRGPVRGRALEDAGHVLARTEDVGVAGKVDMRVDVDEQPLRRRRRRRRHDRCAKSLSGSGILGTPAT